MLRFLCMVVSFARSLARPVQAHALLSRMWHADPKQRPSFAEILPQMDLRFAPPRGNDGNIGSGHGGKSGGNGRNRSTSSSTSTSSTSSRRSLSADV
jgi:hypothetical protein